jgi:hypothetical protein
MTWHAWVIAYTVLHKQQTPVTSPASTMS